MLYLAEVDKSIMGRASLVPIAKQQPDQTWVAVTEEAIPSNDANALSKGVLVLVDVAGNRQTRNVREAAKELVGILQSFGRRLQENKGDMDEIETWRQSLHYQSTALTERSLDLDEREEKLAEEEQRYVQYQEEMAAFDARKQEIDNLAQQLAEEKQSIGKTRSDLNHREQELAEQQAEIERLRQELEGQLVDVQQSSLSGDDAQRLQDAIQALWQALEHNPAAAQGVVNTIQQQLDQRLADAASQLEPLQAERQQLEGQQQEIEAARQAWQQRYQDWARSQADGVGLARHVQAIETHVRVLDEQLQPLMALNTPREAASQHLWDLINTHDVLVADDSGNAGTSVSPEELEAAVNSQRRIYDENYQMFSEQMTELDQHRQNIAALEAKLATAKNDDRFDIESDLDYAREAAKILQESLAPQQTNINEIEAQLRSQEALLAQIKNGDASTPTISLGGAIAQLRTLANQQQAVSQTWMGQLQSLREALGAKQAELAQLSATLAEQQQHLQADFVGITDRLRGCAEAWGKVCSRIEELQANQHHYGALRQQIEPLRDAINQSQASERAQLEIIQGVVQTAIAS